MALLDVRGLKTHFSTEDGPVRAVDGVSFHVDRGEVLGIVGESGSGKSVTSLSLLRLIPEPPGKIVAGEMLFESSPGKKEDLARATEARMRQVRGDRIAMIFQDPMTSLNPYLRVSEQLVEVLELHKKMKRPEARQKAIEMLRAVGIPAPELRIDDHPHQLSGGMRQRVMIAMALSCDPKVLIADEPTTALDVTIQAQILDLMREIRESFGTAIVLITHDMGVVAENADRVVVMYAGRKVEEADVDDLFDNPAHPYTKGLLAAIPHLDDAARADAGRTRLNEIKGMVPSLAHLPPGCSFAPRCGFASDRCREAYPPFEEVRPRHWAACWHAAALMGDAR